MEPRCASRVAGGLLLGFSALACAPKVEVVAPKEPIVINMNLKIEHEIRVKVDRDLEDLFAEDGDIFGVPAEPTKEPGA